MVAVNFFVLIAFGLLLVAGCSREKSHPASLGASAAPAISSTAADLGKPLTWRDSVDVAEAAAIRDSNGKVSRTGAELRVHLIDGHDAIFKDDTTPGLQFARPRYVGYLDPIHSHLIHTLQYEGSGVYQIVDGTTGDSTLLFGRPVPSPDGSRFVVTSMADIQADGDFIEVWRIIGGKPVKEFFYDSDDDPWSPSDPVWKDSVTIDFTKNSHAEPGQPYEKKAARLHLAGKKWLITDLP